MQLAVLNLSVYTQLWLLTGESVLLADASGKQIEALVKEGFPVRLLDRDSSSAAYFLVANLQKGKPDLILNALTVLDVIGDVLVVRGDPAVVEQFPVMGIPIQRLQRHPFLLPAEGERLRQVAAVTPDPFIASMIDQVDTDTAYDYVGGLSGEWPVQVNDNPYTFNTRYSYAETPIKKATKYVQEHFLDLGLTVYYSTFYIGQVELRNVIADQPGITDPDCIVMLVGHLDSISPVAATLAPGADDNASGTAGVLIGADILSQYDFTCTIRYIAFTGEEQGMLGSQDYAAEVSAAGEGVVAVVNLDMIAYNSDASETVELHTRPANSGDLGIANLFTEVVMAYEIDLQPEIVQDALWFSDHSSFWDYGYAAMLAIEDYSSDFNPYYHTTSDTLAQIDPGYMANFIRAAVGTVAHLAGPIEVDKAFLPLLFR